MGGKYYDESTGRCKDLTAKKSWFARLMAVFKSKPADETIVRRNRVLSPSMFDQSYDQVDGAGDNWYSTIKSKRDARKENDHHTYIRYFDILFPEDNVTLSPTTALYSKLGGSSTHTLRNDNHNIRFVYKVICNKKECSASIDCGFLEPNSAVYFTVTRRKCKKDTSLLKIRIGMVPDYTTDPVLAYSLQTMWHVVSVNMYAFPPIQK